MISRLSVCGLGFALVIMLFTRRFPIQKYNMAHHVCHSSWLSMKLGILHGYPNIFAEILFLSSPDEPS